MPAILILATIIVDEVLSPEKLKSPARIHAGLDVRQGQDTSLRGGRNAERCAWEFATSATRLLNACLRLLLPTWSFGIKQAVGLPQNSISQRGALAQLLRGNASRRARNDGRFLFLK
jgi:hypothetical protein